jgi:hypothetical protein
MTLGVRALEVFRRVIAAIPAFAHALAIEVSQLDHRLRTGADRRRSRCWTDSA